MTGAFRINRSSSREPLVVSSGSSVSAGVSSVKSRSRTIGRIVDDASLGASVAPVVVMTTAASVVELSVSGVIDDDSIFSEEDSVELSLASVVDEEISLFTTVVASVVLEVLLLSIISFSRLKFSISVLIFSTIDSESSAEKRMFPSSVRLTFAVVPS